WRNESLGPPRFSASARRTLRSAARASRRLTHGLQVRADDGVVRIQLERALPAANGFVPLAAPQPNVAELEIHVVAELRVRFRCAQVRLERVVVPPEPVVEISQVLMQLRQRRILEGAALRRRAGLVVF